MIAPSSPFKISGGWRLPQLCVVGKVLGRWRLTQLCVAGSCSEGLSVELRGRSLVVGRERCLMQVGDGLCGGDVPRVFARTVADVISLRRLIYPIKITHE
ncbi:unnamed protein product [Brassica napus]|uniref:(rape) hypothetical protein n=1 Tax=Brassica napus TaxID=3708 RepID=A0A816SPT3_BRANA|nr:unnamed protein product [Brassica napus]